MSENENVHYVWNGDRTGLVANSGPIDMSRPVFFPVPPATDPVEWSGEWPDGWIPIGYTDGGYAFNENGVTITDLPAPLPEGIEFGPITSYMQRADEGTE